LIFNCIYRAFFDPPDSRQIQQEQNRMNIMAEKHDEWVDRSQAEARRRFLTLEPCDASQTHYRILDSSGQTVFPEKGWGASRSQINGYFVQNPQA
jgi:hypothetical protein